MHKLASREEGTTILAMGNEAVVRGGLEAGLGYFSTYPGTPASEIGVEYERLREDFPHIHTEFSVNEHVAAHGAQGASWAGIRSMSTMKHVGMNVASEVLHFAGYTGVGAGFVIVVGSDPGATSSTSEQDDRWYSLHTHLPILEPADIEEARDYTVRAFELSETYNLPFILNTPSKLCHNIGSLSLGKLPDTFSKRGVFTRNPSRYINLFAGAVQNHRLLMESVARLSRDAGGLGLNRIIPGRGSIGFISSSVNYLYLMEALALLGVDDSPVMKIGLSFPLNRDEIASFVSKCERVYVMEELEGFLEYQIKRLLYDTGIRVPVIGKDIIPPYGEMDVDLITTAISGELKKKVPKKMLRSRELAEKLRDEIPPRQGAFCIGCPHRSTLYSIVEATERKVIFAGDIGCYTLSCLPPFKAFDWVTCMNCGTGIAQGVVHKTEGEEVIAYVGDSTFFHSGIQNIINAVQEGTSMVLVILDNQWVAMTGHQASPTTEYSLQGSRMRPVDLTGLLRSIGVSYIRTINPHQTGAATAAVREALDRGEGVRVIIAREECALQSVRREKYSPRQYDLYFQIDPERCQKCHRCYVDFGCPAIRKEATETDYIYYIEEAACIRCGACHTLCPNSAIIRTEIRRSPECRDREAS